MKNRLLITIAIGVIVFIVGMGIANTQGQPDELEYAIYYLASVRAMSAYWIGSRSEK